MNRVYTNAELAAYFAAMPPGEPALMTTIRRVESIKTATTCFVFKSVATDWVGLDGLDGVESRMLTSPFTILNGANS